MSARVLIMVSLLAIWPGTVLAESKQVSLYAAPELIESGLFKHILPRFSLKTQVRVSLVDSPGEADLVLGDTGSALFEGLDRTWHMDLVSADAPSAQRFADWLKSEVGQRTIIGYAPDGVALFAAPAERQEQATRSVMTGNAQLGHEVARAMCTRCHAVDDETRMAGIGSTPSFSVLRSLGDWENRFSTFYVLKPHAAFVEVEGLDPLFTEDRPPPIAPVEMTLEEVDAVVAYVAAMPPADLGAPLQHQ